MKITFFLCDAGKPRDWKRLFKHKAAAALVDEYCSRIRKFTPCEIRAVPLTAAPAGGRTRRWVCHRNPGGESLASEEVARRLQKALDAGATDLEIYIGGADGFCESDLAALKPVQKWSFGALTLPHEIAAVVAAEQVYRAWCILRNLPYHQGHQERSHAG